MFLKNKNIIFKTRRSKVTDYAALRRHCNFGPWLIFSKTNKNGHFVKETDTYKLLYEQFIHLTQIILHPNIQF